jgi:hypothetical protein
VRRAYSHYWHEHDKGRETLSFEEAIRAEPERLADAEQRLASGGITASREHQLHSYLARGRYAEQFERWFALFPREQFLVLRFEDLSADPLATLNRTLGWLGLPPLAEARTEPRNTRRYPPMASETAERLREYYAPHEARLQALLAAAPAPGICKTRSEE